MHATRLSTRLSPDTVIYPDYRRHMEHEIRDGDADAVADKVIYPDYRRGLDTAERDTVAEDDEKVIYPESLAKQTEPA